jgi:hypothetical protein
VNEKSLTSGVELRLEVALDGVQNAFPASIQQVPVRGVTYTQASLAAKIQDVRSPWKTVRDAHATIRQFAQDKPELTRGAIQLLGDLKSSLAGQLGRDSQDLAKFGFTPLKRPKPLTVEEKVLRAAKAKLTRKKRRTKGSRELSEIKETAAPTVTITADAPMSVAPASPVSPNPVDP